MTTTRNYSYTHFCRFLAVLEYSPIGVKFPPTIAWRILYTVKKKKFENFQNFFVFKVLRHLSNFFAKTRFLILFWRYVVNISWLFYCRNLIRGYFVTTKADKKVENMILKFFSNSAFSRFFQDFHHILYYISISIRDILTISTAMSS